MTNIRFSRGDVVRFEKFYSKTDGCWEWTGGTACGYGNFSIKSKSIRAHRFSYAAYKGKLKDGMVVMHECDNCVCVNPAHLRQATQSENILDCSSKGRHDDRRGSKNTNSKLTEADVVEIRILNAEGKSQKEIAGLFNVCKGSISCILLSKTWNHVQ